MNLTYSTIQSLRFFAVTALLAIGIAGCGETENPFGIQLTQKGDTSSGKVSPDQVDPKETTNNDTSGGSAGGGKTIQKGLVLRLCTTDYLTDAGSSKTYIASTYEGVESSSISLYYRPEVDSKLSNLIQSSVPSENKICYAMNLYKLGKLEPSEGRPNKGSGVNRSVVKLTLTPSKTNTRETPLSSQRNRDESNGISYTLEYIFLDVKKLKADKWKNNLAQYLQHHSYMSAKNKTQLSDVPEALANEKDIYFVRVKSTNNKVVPLDVYTPKDYTVTVEN